METMTGSGSYTFTLSNETIIYYYLLCTASTSFNEKVYIQFERGSVATSFEQYKCNEYQITFPSEAGTVYGGTLTIHQDGTGLLKVKTKINLYDGSSDESWSYNAGKVYFGGSFGSEVDQTVKGISNMFKWNNNVKSSIGNLSLGEISFGNTATNYQINAYPAGMTSASDFTTYLASNNLQVMFFLAEPQEFPLTAQQVVSLLKGQNVLWADCGNISMEYPADTKLYLDGKIAELQALILENISNS